MKKSLFISAFLSLMYGCASIEDSVSPAYVIDHKQSDAHKLREPVKRLISPATQSASYWNLSLSNDGDVAIQIPVNSRGHGEYETLSNGRRALIVKFTCDYEKGETTGRASVGFDGPSWHGLIKVRCIPMSSEEVAQQLDEEAKRQRIAAEEAARTERIEAERLEKEREKVRLAEEQKKIKKAEEARLAALKETPQYKMNEAANQVRMAQRFITGAQSAIENEKEIGRVSGYVNTSRLHEAGSAIVYYEKMQQNQWKIYKANGGQAKSIGELLSDSK